MPAGLALIDRGAAVVATAREWSLSDAELRDAVGAGAAALARLEAAWLGLVRALDGRPEAVAGARPGKTAATFLIHGLRVSAGRAHADVAAAHAIDPDEGPLPRMGAALAAGEVSRAHLDVAVRAIARIPAHLTRAMDADGVSGAARVDAFLTDQSQVLPPAGTDRLARHLLATLDPSGGDRYDPAAFERRSLSCAVDGTGMLVGRFQLDPAAAAVVKAALDAFAAPAPVAVAEADGSGGAVQQVLVGDGRTRPQRYADALTTIARRALFRAPDSAGEPPHILVVATPDQVRDAAHHQHVAARGEATTPIGQPPGPPPAAPGAAECVQVGPIRSGTLSRLMCDSILQTALLAPGGAVLNLGRAVRTATGAQRRALIARDRGCIIAGCGAPPTACEAHHIRWWRHGGGTNIDNLALVCSVHHTAVHAGVWTLEMRDGVPWALPPPWIDPQRRPLRNATHHATDAARRLGQQLRLTLDHGEAAWPPERPDPPDP